MVYFEGPDHGRWGGLRQCKQGSGRAVVDERVKNSHRELHFGDDEEGNDEGRRC